MTEIFPADHVVYQVFVTVWGALWGSFLNVVIARLPRGMSLTRPASHCFSCKKPIPFYHNIPIVSFLILRGKCAKCGVGYSSRYMLIELVCAFLSLTLWRYLLFVYQPAVMQGILVAYIVYFVMIMLLLAITFIDLEHFLIPNVLSVPGMIAGLVAHGLFSKYTGVLFFEAILGCLLGGGSILLLIEGYFRLTGREGMGGGDFKLMALVGAFLGWKALPFVFFFSSTQGVIAAIVLRALNLEPEVPDYLLEMTQPQPVKDDESNAEQSGEQSAIARDPSFGKMVLPFGPFIALAALEFLFFGQPFIRWYTSLMMRI